MIVKEKSSWSLEIDKNNTVAKTSPYGKSVCLSEYKTSIKKP
jgi:hypothetical protein